MNREFIEVEREHLEYIIKGIYENIAEPYMMANEEVAKEMFPYIQEEFPNAQMIQYEIMQYIVVSKQGRTALMEQMESLKKEKEKSIKEIEQILFELKKCPC